MARCDFSNAKLEPASGTRNVIEASMLGLTWTYGNLYIDYNGTYKQISQNASLTRVDERPSQVKYIYTGIFTEAGNHFYFGRLSTNDDLGLGGCWKISNISFNAGDSYNFEVDGLLTFN